MEFTKSDGTACDCSNSHRDTLHFGTPKSSEMILREGDVGSYGYEEECACYTRDLDARMRQQNTRSSALNSIEIVANAPQANSSS